jgi:hypothetical protein
MNLRRMGFGRLKTRPCHGWLFAAVPFRYGYDLQRVIGNNGAISSLTVEASQVLPRHYAVFKI